MPTTYDIVDADRKRVENAFTHHPPKEDQAERYELIREKAKELAVLFLRSTPPSRERSLALTHLEEAVFNANAAIARNE